VHGAVLLRNVHKTYTHNTQPFYGSVEFVRDNPGEPVPEETSDGSITKFEFNFNFNYFSISVYFFVVTINSVVQSLGLGFRLGLGLRTIEAIGVNI